jgi:ureidoglycolate dehydrogenase (NAD+)
MFLYIEDRSVLSMGNDESDPKLRVDQQELESFAFEILTAAGVTKHHARTVADALVRADLRGVDSHGLARLEIYVRKFENGGFNPDPNIRVESIADTAVLVDADDGPGQSAATRAMEEAIAMAGGSGIGIAGVTNSNHFGTAAYYTEKASDAGYVGLAMTNVVSDVAPFGGTDAFLGTNPISFSIPTDREYPITLDMATSVVAMGKVDHVAEAGDQLPDDWALDENGEPATSPEEVEALRPVGGPKGFGLGLVVDALCGVLTGAGTSETVGELYDDFDKPMRLGHFVAAIDVDSFRGEETFRQEMGLYIDRLKSQDTQDGVDEIRVPGELETLEKQRNETAGVPVNADAQRGLRNLAERFDIPLPDGFE